MTKLLVENRSLIKKEIRSLQEDISLFYNDNEIVRHREWQLLLDHFFNKKTGKPNKKWITITRTHLDTLNSGIYRKYIEGFLVKIMDLLKLIHEKNTGGEVYFLLEQFQEFYKGVVWSIPWCDGQEYLYRYVNEIALLCFKKIPKHGAISVKLGNACLYCFSCLETRHSVQQLMVIKNKIKYPSVRKKIDQYLVDIATRVGKTVSEITEVGIADFGFSHHHKLKQTIGDYDVEIILEDDGLVTNWFKRAVSLGTKIPNAVKNNHKDFHIEYKQLLKELKQFLTVQKQRLEGLFLARRLWLFKDWKEAYLKHHLIGFFAKKILWRFRQGEQVDTVLWTIDGWVNNRGEIINWVNDEVSVSLWHPVDASVEEILGWRNYLLEQQIRQPFKQVFREVYLLTDAERRTATYSNRFAAHILRQHQFAALCKVRNWEYKLKGYWENSSIPTCKVPDWGLTAEFWVEIDWDGEMTDARAFKLVFTDQVRFYEEGELLNLEAVPPIVFSELMRDVDLFVGVTSIGNDAAWRDNNTRHNEYWHQYSFSALTETAKLRKVALENIIPKLGIARQCKIKGRFLEVRGKRRTYKIHIGSGNILMEPNDQYLCIIPDAKQTKQEVNYLPFEGDKMLSIIISKALLLAKDTDIKDPVILRQILD